MALMNTSECILHCALLCELNDDDDDDYIFAHKNRNYQSQIAVPYKIYF